MSVISLLTRHIKQQHSCDMLFEDMQFIRKFSRRLEPQIRGGYFAEKWNTLSNFLFVVIGLCRIYQWHEEYDFADVMILYTLFSLAGVCSGIHHAFHFRYSIVLDWIPISTSLIFCGYYQVWRFVSLGSWVQIFTALGILFNDHVFQTIMPPWGHVMWHITAAMAIDHAYCDYIAAKFITPNF